MSTKTPAAWLDHAILLVGYLLLDWVSYIHPLHGLSITPWNPAPALGVFFLVRHGVRAAPVLWLAIFLADVWVRELPASLPATVVLAGVLMLGYWAIAEFLSWRIGGALFRDLRSMRDWVLAIALGSLANSILFVSLLSVSHLVPAGGWDEALIRSWIGDGVGLLVALPAFWLLFEPAGRAQLAYILRSRSAAAYLLAVPFCLWLAFGFGADNNFKYFYVLFLPLAGAAAMQGLAGAMVCAAVLQIGIITGLVWLRYPAITVFEVQVLSVALAMFGFLLGLLVDERERLNQELRQTLRLAAAGEMAGALAHELNQPMTALSAYGSVCQSLLDRDGGDAELKKVVARMVAEATRAADVVRRLRDFFRTGETHLEPVLASDILSSVVAGFRKRADADGVVLELVCSGDGPILVDRLQMEVVLRNLLANAFDAVLLKDREARHVEVALALCGEWLNIAVRDSGHGLPPQIRENLFDTFRSTKSQGMGLGLAISRAIVDAHGGRLWAEQGEASVFSLELPIGDALTVKGAGSEES
jgi:signal transduction histidine kinase